MLTRLSNRLVLSNRLSLSALTVQVRFDSGLGSVQVKNVDIVRKSDRISEILARVNERDGLLRQKSHVEHLVGRLSKETSDKSNDMAGLDIADKTEIILQSCHPVRHILERFVHCVYS